MTPITSGTITIAGGNNVTLSQNGNAVTVSAANQSVQTQNMVSLLGSTGDISFANSNGITFGGNGSTVTASHNGITSQSVQTVGLYGLLNTSGSSSGSADARSLSISAIGGLSADMDGGVVKLVAPYGFSAGVSTVGNTSGNTGLANKELVLAGGNNVTLSVSSSADMAFGVSRTVTISTPNQTAQTLGMYGYLNTSGGGSSNTADARSLSISAYGGASVNLGNPGELHIAAPYPLSVGMSTLGNTSGNSVLVNKQLILVGGNNVTLSGSSSVQTDFGMSGTITISAGGETRNYFNPQDAYIQVTGRQGQGTMHLQPMYAPNVTFDRLAVPMVISNDAASTGSGTLSVGFGIYTRTSGTLSLVSSTSNAFAVTYSGTVNNSTFSGLRNYTIPWSSSLSEGQYWVGMWSRTTTGGNNASMSQVLASQMNSVYAGIFGQAPVTSDQYTRGLGHYSATFSTALPSQVAFSEIVGTGQVALRQPIFYFVQGTF